MALIPAKVIARVHATSDSLEELSWEWVLRADGQVSYRLIAVGGRRERNPWIAAARLPAGGPQALGRGQEKARVVLESLACQRGHQARRARGQLSTGARVRRKLAQGPSTERAPGPDAGRIGTGESGPGALNGDGMGWQPGDAPALGNSAPRAAHVLLPHPRRDMSRSGPWLRDLQTAVTSP